MFSLKHLFHSPKGDGPDTTLVKPGDWNNEHVMVASASGVVVGRISAGPGPMEEVPIASMLPSGIIVPFGGSVIPAGWLVCHGQALVRTAQPTLFAAIGTTYGNGDGSGFQFNVPDLLGRVIAGNDLGVGRLNYGMTGVTSGSFGGVQSESAGVTVSVFGYVDVAGYVRSWYMDTEDSDVNGLQFGGSGIAAQTHRHGNVLSQPDPPGTWAGSIRNDGVNNKGYGASATVSNIQPTLTMEYIIKT